MKTLKVSSALASIAAVLALVGCAANDVRPEARDVEIVNEAPDKARCRFLGEVAGSQGNWFTGDMTSNKNLIVGARNDLRNETKALGGNVVYVQDLHNSSAYRSLGTTNATAIGKAYLCR